MNKTIQQSPQAMALYIKGDVIALRTALKEFVKASEDLFVTKVEMASLPKISTAGYVYDKKMALHKASTDLINAISYLHSHVVKYREYQQSNSSSGVVASDVSNTA